MRLKCIKLVGFKSFVDMTTVTFPDNMCGVVGPNGCGKSNIIDAVRWVMGESSAKNLRGESMTDVIFKGSKSRKAAGYAQVELIFDNTQGRVSGEYASYAELSVKRRLTSDTQNTYFLNGTKCRRRDIMDIFLGTGLGPRSYSIISQGMISSLIESRPEELRVFIEEAAGISKYKERRRETENRIRRTNENLERLGDLREELDKRLIHLKKQAEAAEKYKSFKEEERRTRAQLHAIRWKNIHESMTVQHGLIRESEVEMEAKVTSQVSSDSQIDKLKIERQSCEDSYQGAQSLYYETGNHITRLEQMISHRKEKQEQLSRDLDESQTLEKEIETQLLDDRQALAEMEEESETLLPAQSELEEHKNRYHQALQHAEESMAAWQKRWDVFRVKTEKTRRNAEVAQSGIQHVEHVLSRLDENIRRNSEELEMLEENQFADDLDDLREREYEQEEQRKILETRADGVGKDLIELRSEIEQLLQKRQRCYQQLNEAKGTRASLRSLQEDALHHGEKSQQWLRSHGLDSAVRVVDSIRVLNGWDTAVETVLGDFVQSLSVEKVEEFAEIIRESDEIDVSAISLVSGKKKQQDIEITEKFSNISLLADHVEGGSHLPFLQHVLSARTMDDALEILPLLSTHESVITKDGVWLGANWVKVAKEGKSASGGVLARQQALDDIEKVLQRLSDESEDAQTELGKAQDNLLSLEQLQKETVQKQTENERELGEVKAEISAIQVRLEEENFRRERLRESAGELQEQYAMEQEKLAEYRESLQESLDVMEEDNREHESFEAEKMTLKEALDTRRQELALAQEKAHEIALKKQELHARHHGKLQAVERLEAQMERVKERIGNLNKLICETGESDDKELSEKLGHLLEKQSEEQGIMMDARSKLDAVDEQLKEYERVKITAENEMEGIRSRLEKLRMDEQAMRIRCTTIEEQLADEHFDLMTLISGLPEKVDEGEWEQALASLESRISGLGAINLAAIEEYDQQSERLRYLNIQNDDLEDALSTLQDAIDRIDTETRNRFDSTFNQVNEGLKEIFPRVFGGGQAYLERTGEDLLDTGVTIMAQPPGKKNSTIHLLSGGEKALTAIALVFSIFRLNPSPFCLLDEVDAPLDDANVGRYAKMVTEMSSQVQFIYVTHNKIAMEAAGQLIGVTMHEPGVSRPVSVDIDAAAEMATA